jgi:hypothetical protein
MTTDNFCFYLQNSLIQTNETGGQWYSDTSPFSIPCLDIPGRAQGNVREPKTYLGRVFNYMLGCYDDVHVLIYVHACPCL